MNDKDLEIEYLKKIDLLQRYNKHYYDKNKLNFKLNQEIVNARYLKICL